jgi:DNA mismatch repair protein MutL
VNVHPAKTEVRFRYPRDLYELVRHAIGQALGETPAHAGFPASRWGPRDAPRGARPGAASPDMSLPGVVGGPAPPPSAVPLPWEPPGTEGPGERFFSSLVPAGQVLGTYLVCEGVDGLVLVDQHAADERIVFSRLKDRYLGGTAPVQRWLRAEPIDLPGVLRDERPAVEEFLARAGFLFEPAGDGRLLLTGGPAALGAFDARRWWEEVCEFLRAQETLPKDVFDADRELWRMACHASVRGGDRLSTDRARLLLAELDRAVAAHSCPHGRPVWVRIPRARLEAMFRRDG